MCLSAWIWGSRRFVVVMFCGKCSTRQQSGTPRYAMVSPGFFCVRVKVLRLECYVCMDMEMLFVAGSRMRRCGFRMD